MIVFKDYYKILDLNEITFDEEKIKEGYKRQAKKYHPDINKNINTEIFNDIYEAYQVLSNPTKKRAYDRLWLSYIKREEKENKTYEHKKRKTTVEDEIRNLFLGKNLNDKLNKKRKEKELKDGTYTIEKNIVIDLEISLKEAFFGTNKEISFKNLNNDIRTITLKIPSGVQNKDILRIKNFEKSKDKIEKTNLLINIFIKEEEDQKIEGINLRKTIYLYPWDFATGKKININVLDEDLSVFIPKHTYKNFTYKLNQKGYIDKHGFRGDLFIDIVLKLPDSFSDDIIKIYDDLKNTYEKNKE